MHLLFVAEQRKFHNSRGDQLRGKSQVILEYVTSRLSFDIFYFWKSLPGCHSILFIWKKICQVGVGQEEYQNAVNSWSWLYFFQCLIVLSSICLMCLVCRTCLVCSGLTMLEQIGAIISCTRAETTAWWMMRCLVLWGLVRIEFDPYFSGVIDYFLRVQGLLILAVSLFMFVLLSTLRSSIELRG
jgi:hypothetical protein